MNGDRIVGDVAATVGLDEGEAGVRDVLRAVVRFEPVAVRKLSRATELPVPFVSAICNELRKRGVVSTQRPVRLTPRGRDVFGGFAPAHVMDACCPTCAGREIVLPPALTGAVRRLAVLAKQAPPPRLELDQVHCTVETKVRRVLAMYEAGALADRRILLLGDDDLTSVAIGLVADHLGPGLPIRGVVVLDVDPAVLSFVRHALRGASFPVECVTHDLRDPLPVPLRGAADTVFADPPFTSQGAALFLARAAEAVGRPGRDVFLAFGSSRPATALALQRTIAERGFVVRRLIRNFNEYVGAGILGGTSHLYHLASTAELRPAGTGRHDGPLYTADFREAVRRYRCKRCAVIQRVGRGRTWSSVNALKESGCPRCGGTRFVPLARA